ncbi:MAG: lipid II:glycine glycyltransferase FemX [Bacteroidia bacterium]
MKIIGIDEIENSQIYPYFYLKEYIYFIKNEESKDVLFFTDELENTITCKTWKNKFLKLIQPTYPPLSKRGERLSEQQEQDFLNKWVEFLSENKLTHRISQPENFAIFKTIPNHSVYAPFGTYYLNLEKKTEDELFKNLHTKHRNVIKNAEKNKVELKYGKECINDFYSLYKQTMKRANMYCQDISYFNNFYNSLAENSICGVAYYNSIPQGGLFMPYTKFGAFYLYGSSAEKVEINGAITYLHWNTIKLLKQKGVKRYDFVGARLSDVSGTKLKGIQQFKERFGAELENGFLWKKDLDKLTCNLFDSLVILKLRLKNQKPPMDIIEQEREKVND